MGASIANTQPILSYVDWKGSVRFVADVARRFGPRDVVLFEQPRNIHLLSAPLWGLYGADALEFRRFNPDPERLRHLVAAWRPVYGTSTWSQAGTDVCGLFLERTQTFRFTSEEFEWTYDRVPRKPGARAVSFLSPAWWSPRVCSDDRAGDRHWRFGRSANASGSLRARRRGNEPTAGPAAVSTTGAMPRVRSFRPRQAQASRFERRRISGRRARNPRS